MTNNKDEKEDVRMGQNHGSLCVGWTWKVPFSMCLAYNVCRKGNQSAVVYSCANLHRGLIW